MPELFHPSGVRFNLIGKRSKQKRWRCRSTAKFREETSKKADSSVNDRVAALHNVVGAVMRCKQFFALHQCFFVGQFPSLKILPVYGAFTFSA
jgi:hypothetical protein